MSFSHLLRQLDALGPLPTRAPITFDLGFSGSAELITVFRAVLDAESLTINSITDQMVRDHEHLELTGTVTALGLVDAPAKLVAKDLNGELFLKLAVELPSGWSFGTMFPRLPGRATGKLDETGEKVLAPHFMNELGLGACRLVLSTAEHFDETLGRKLSPGLNFAGELYPLGVLYPLGFVLRGSGPFPLAGPLHEYRSTYDPLAFTGIRLTAPLPLEAADLGPLSIQKARLFLKTGVDEHQRDKVVSATQGSGIYLLADGTFGGRPIELIGKVDVDDSDEITVRGVFSDFGISGFSSLSQTTGVSGIGDDLPEGLRAPEGLAVTEVGATFGYIRPSLSALSLGVGMKTRLEVIPNAMTLEEIGVTFHVTDPLGKGRRLRTTLTGLLAFKKFSLAAYAELPGFRLGAGLAPGQTLPLGDVIESLLPGDVELPPLTVTKLFLQASPKEKTFSLSAIVEDALSIPVGKTAFEVQGLALVVEYDRAGGGARGLVRAQMGIADALVVLSGELDNGLTLSGSLSDFSLKKLWALVSGGDQLPDEIPEIVFQTLDVRFTPATGAFSVRGDATVAWEHLSSAGALQTNVQFTLTRDVSGSAGSKTSAITANLSLQGQGPVKIAEGFSLQSFNLLFDYRTGGGWSLSGGMGADVFDTRLDLQAGYESAQGVKKIKLRANATPEKKLIDIDGVGSYTFSQFDLLIDRRVVEGKTRTYFDLRLASTLAIDGLCSAGGFLSVANTAEGKQSLLFKPNPGSADFRVRFPTGEGMAIQGQLFEIGFAKEAGAGWSFTGTMDLGFTGFPGFLGKALPSKVTAKLVAGKSDLRLSALNVTAPVGVPFPAVRGKSLGKAVVQLLELGVSLKPQPGLVIEAGLGLPAELNDFLKTQLFRVYEPGNPTSMSRTRLTISETGVAAQFLSSPFAAANAAVVNGESWFDVDFGQYGAVSLKMPTFVYDGVAQYFEAGGGIKIKRPLALPLAPLKMFLEACGSKGMADVFPAKIPIEGIALTDQKGNLKIDELVAFLKKAGDVPGEVTSALKKAGKVLDRLPDDFKQYLNLELPEHLEFKLGFSPTGRVTLGLLAPKKPVRVLFPAMVQSFVPMPGLWGIEVRKLSVGTLMAGSVLYGEIDAVIDQFDLPSLIVSLALPSDPDFPLPMSNELRRRIILDDVFCVIPISAGVPVPIPLFYDELGFEYLGIEGIGLQAHVGFPQPALGASSAGAVFKAFEEFSTKPKALLDPKTPPGGVDLAFTFHDELMQAPEYLGGGVLGTQGKTIKVSAWKYLASMLNFAKTFSINECIGAIPIEQRVGSAHYRFAFLELDADWLLTTPAEFKGGAFERLKLTAGDREDFLAVLPSVASSGGQQVKGGEEGLVTFLRGQADLGFLRLEAAFGLAASGSMGFNTGFKLEGSIGKVELQLAGAVMVNAPLATGTSSSAKASPPARATQPVPAARTAPGERALSLNGKNAWIEIPASDSLILPEYTVELWLKPAQDQAGEWVELFGIDTLEGGSHQRNHYLELNIQNGFYHHRFKDSSGGNAGAPNTPNGSVGWGRWQHVALTNDGTTAKTYVDGKEAASGPVKGGLVLLKAPLFLGKEPGGQLNKLWKGEIAEVRIWKRARGGNDIAERMREIIATDEQDLVSLYRFDQDTGGRAVDACGRNHGTIKNGAFVQADFLMLQGLELDGKSQHIEIPDSPSLRIGPYTVEAWIKPFVPRERLGGGEFDWFRQTNALTGKGKKEERSEWGGVFGKPSRNYAVLINRKGYIHHRFHTSKDWNDGAPDTPEGLIAWNRWNHVAITNDGKTARTFVNGVKQAEGPVGGNGLIVDSSVVTIGRSGLDNKEYFSGELGEIRLWSGARSAEDIVANMDRRLAPNVPSLVSLWRMEGVKGNALPDLCGKNPGRLTWRSASASASGPAPLRHDGLVFNGGGDYALIDRSDKLDLDTYTIEIWVRPDQAPPSSWQCLWGAGGQATSIYLSKDGVVSHRCFVKVTEGQLVAGAKGQPPDLKLTTKVKGDVLNTDVGQVRFGEWNHIAVTYDGTMCRILVNGAVKAQRRLPGPLVSEAASVTVGRSGGEKGQDHFRGSIDDIRVWSVARSPEQVAASMNVPLARNEAQLVAYYTMDHTSGSQLTDSGPNKLHGQVRGAQWALAVAPGEPERAAIQIQGHTHLKVLGREVLSGDLRLVDSTFWFRGRLDLFPPDWPISVRGQVEGMVSQQRFYLSGETENALFGLVLSSSRLFISNEQMRLEGRWLGMFLLLNISWDKDDPLFAGSVGFSTSPTLEFGAIRIGGVKVADNVRLKLDIGVDVSVSISKRGFAGNVHARFQVNGEGFDLSFGIDVAPGELGDLVNWVKQRIIDEPEKYLAHLFSDAEAWLKNVASGAIKFARNAGAAVGAALKSGFKLSKEATAALMKNSGYAAHQVGDALGKAYGVATKEAAGMLKGIGYAVEDVGNALRSAFQVGADDAARMLKDIGFNATDVNKALTSAFNKSANECEKILKSVGFSSKDVSSAVKSAGKAIEKGAEDAYEAVKFW